MNDKKTEDCDWNLAAPPTATGSIEPTREVDPASNLVPFSSRIDSELKHKLKLYSVRREQSIIEVLDSALTKFLEAESYLDSGQ